MLACLICAATFAVAPAGLSEDQTLTRAVRIGAATTGGDAARVELVVDGWVRAVDRSAPFVFDWDTAREPDGRHTVELWAVAQDGRTASASVGVVVANAFELALTLPAATVAGTARVAVAASGSTPQWVELHVDGRLAAIDPEAPYAFSLDTRTFGNGEHRVSAWGVAPNGEIAEAEGRLVVDDGAEDPVEEPPAESRAQLAKLKAETWAWERLMRATPTRAPQGRTADVAFWRARAARARARASCPPHLDEFLCLHRYEGSWTANTGNGYFGGLQMNMDFQRGYGPELLARKGTANNWTPLEQIWIAERAVPRRGFQPWPTTGRMCGLL